VTAQLFQGQSSTTVLTGPRGSGKTSLIQMFVVIIVLAQVGCFVPADSAELTVFDGLSLVSPNRESKKDGSLHKLVEQATSRTLAVIDLAHNNEYVCRSTSGAER
jgi:DNA mismatch repair ATPase MutS